VVWRDRLYFSRTHRDKCWGDNVESITGKGCMYAGECMENDNWSKVVCPYDEYTGRKYGYIV
jgi:hypothetical protein